MDQSTHDPAMDPSRSGVEWETRVGLPERPVRLGRRSPLTRRQVSVLQLSNAGRTVEEVAALLAIEASSVRRYLQQVYGRLQARSKTEALFLARKAGLIRDE